MNEVDYNSVLKSYIKETSELEKTFLKETLQSRVYHYTSPQGLLGIMKNKSKALLRFTKYDSLNDREESLDIIKHIKIYLESIAKDASPQFIEWLKNFTPNSNTFITSYSELSSCKVFEERECHTYLCCFSEKDDLLPMWNYYTKSRHYEGYNIGFSSSVFRSESCHGMGYRIELQKVIYWDKDKKEIINCIFNPIKNIYHVLTDEQKKHIQDFVQTRINKFQFLFKNSCFSHEKEIRAILRIPKDFNFQGQDSLTKDYRESHGYIVPYIEFELPENAIRSIRVAPLYEKEIAINNLEEFCIEREYKRVSISPSSVPIRF